MHGRRLLPNFMYIVRTIKATACFSHFTITTIGTLHIFPQVYALVMCWPNQDGYTITITPPYPLALSMSCLSPMVRLAWTTDNFTFDALMPLQA